MLRHSSFYFSLTLQTWCIWVPCPPSSMNILSWGKAGTSSHGKGWLAFSVVWCSLRCSLCHLFFGHYAIWPPVIAQSLQSLSGIRRSPYTLCVPFIPIDGPFRSSDPPLCHPFWHSQEQSKLPSMCAGESEGWRRSSFVSIFPPVLFCTVLLRLSLSTIFLKIYPLGQNLCSGS